MSRLLQNNAARKLSLVVAELLSAILSAYSTFQLIEGFGADPVNIGALVKGGLGALVLLLVFAALAVMAVRAKAVRKKESP